MRRPASIDQCLKPLPAVLAEPLDQSLDVDQKLQVVLEAHAAIGGNPV